MASAVIHRLLTKIDHYDKDERYMCLSDMTKEMEKMSSGTTLDISVEKKLVAALLGRLKEDTSNDVQAIAVKCLQVLVTRISDNSIAETCQTLVDSLLRGSVELRDVYAIGVRAVITETPSTPTMNYAICTHLVSPLLAGMRGQVDTGKKGGAGSASSSSSSGSLDVRPACYDSAMELIKRMGGTATMEPFHQALLEANYAGLLDASQALRKRAIACLGVLAPCLSDTLLDSLVSHLLTGLEGGAGSQEARVQVQALGSVVRTVGPRLGRAAPRVVPLLLAQLRDPAAAASDDSANNDAANELRETVLAALESFFTGSTAGSGSAGVRGGRGVLQAVSAASSMSPFLPSILSTAVGWLTFDPNYAYGGHGGEGEDGGDADMEDGGQGGEEEESGYEEEEDYGDADDDDSSWKSRRAAARVLSVIVSSAASGAVRAPPTGLTSSQGTAASPSLVADLVAHLGKQLAQRLKEREETVRLEVLAACSSLLHACHSSLGGVQDLDTLVTSALPEGALAVQGVTGQGMSAGVRATASPVVSSAVTGALHSWLSSLLPAILRVLKSPGPAMVKSRTSALALLRTLLAVLHLDIEGPKGATLGPYLSGLLPSLLACSQERSGSHASGQRLESILALHALLMTLSAAQDGQVLKVHVQAIVAAVATACGDDYYRIQASAVRVVGVLACILRPAAPASRATELAAPIVDGPVFSDVAGRLLQALRPRFEAHDLDQEIKEACLWSASALITHAGDAAPLTQAVGGMIGVLADRAKSENSRVLALKGLAYIAYSPLKIPVVPGVAPLLPDFPSYLRSAARPVRLAATVCLSALAQCQAGALAQQAAALGPALQEVATPLIMGEGDLQLTGVALGLATALATHLPVDIATQVLTASGIGGRVLVLACSPVLASGELSTSPLSPGGTCSAASFLQACVRAGLGGHLSTQPLLAGLVGEALASRGTRAGAASEASAAGVPAGFLTASRAISAILSAAPSPAQGAMLAAVLADATGTGQGGGLPNPDGTETSISHPTLSRLIIADVGRVVDIPSHLPGSIAALLATVQGSVTGGDEARAAAAMALGGVIAGNPQAAMPALLSALTSAVSVLPVSVDPSLPGASSSIFYASGLLQALRETLARGGGGAGGSTAPAGLGISVTPILELLLSPAVGGCGHEIIRSLAAECAGKCVALDTGTTLAALSAGAAQGNATRVRACSMAALKHAVPFVTNSTLPASQRASLESALSAALPSILGHGVAAGLAAGEGDNSVYMAALGSLTAAAYTAPSILLNHASWKPVPATTLVPAFEALFPSGATAAAGGLPSPPSLEGAGTLAVLAYACIPRADLVREIELGPFKHRVDDATPARKAALVALDALVQKVPSAMAAVLDPQANAGTGAYSGMSALLPVLLTTAVDPDADVAMLSHGWLLRMCQAGLLPRLLPGVYAADALADALSVSVKSATVASLSSSAGAGAGPDSSPADGPAPLADTVRTSLRALDAVARALPDAVSASKKLQDLYIAADKSEATRAIFAAIRSEGRAMGRG